MRMLLEVPCTSSSCCAMQMLLLDCGKLVSDAINGLLSSDNVTMCKP